VIVVVCVLEQHRKTLPANVKITDTMTVHWKEKAQQFFRSIMATLPNIFTAEW
jgi:hypothetical protein